MPVVAGAGCRKINLRFLRIEHGANAVFRTVAHLVVHEIKYGQIFQ